MRLRVVQCYATFNNNSVISWWSTLLSSMIQLYRGGQFNQWNKPEKTSDLPQVTDKLYHTMLYQGYCLRKSQVFITITWSNNNKYLKTCKNVIKRGLKWKFNFILRQVAISHKSQHYIYKNTHSIYRCERNATKETHKRETTQILHHYKYNLNYIISLSM